MSKKLSQDSYEIMSKDYGEFVDTKPWNADYERPCTMKLLENIEGLTILDAGCAGGWYTKKLLELKTKKVIALDFSPKMVEETKKRLKDERLDYQIYNHDLNQEITFIEDNSIDKIVSSLTMHYLTDWTTPLKEFHRILKDNGKLIISVHHPFMEHLVHSREDYFKEEIITDTWNMNDKKVEVKSHYKTLSTIINYLTNAGFLIEKLEEPMPTLNFKLKNEKAYEKLLKRPQFLFIRCIKR